MRTIVGMMLVLAVTACGNQPLELDNPDPALRLRVARQAWESHQIRSYEFDFNWACFCAPAHNRRVTIHVVDGQITDVTDQAGASLPAVVADEYLTVTALFNRIQSAVDADFPFIDVTYDAELGFPDNALLSAEDPNFDSFEAFHIAEVRP